MMDLKPKRLSTWKLLGILAAVGVALLVAAVFWVRSVTEVRWIRFQEEMKAGVEKERTRDSRRPPLRGTAEPGNAWDDYTLAIADMKKVQNREKLGELVDRRPKADAAWGATAIEQNDGILDSLRRGASRTTSRCPYDWAQAIGKGTGDLLEAQNVVNLAILKARARIDAGKPREAAALILDAAQFGRDLADEGSLIAEMIGVALLNISLDGARELAASEKADPQALADLEQGLAVLDGSFPKHAVCIRREHRAMFLNFEREGSAGGFLSKLFNLNLIDRLRAAQEQLEVASDRPWAESLATGKRVDAELQQSWNPIVRMFKPGEQSTERYMRERLAQLRLLRVATQYRRTGERLDLADPFGTTLKSAPAGAGLKLWSVGRDGVDDSGSGEWRPSAGADIVLEARR